MTLYDYVAYSNPAGANEVVRYYGWQPSRDPRVTAKQLAHCVAVKKDEALNMIAKVHPDFALIESQIEKPRESFSNSCGCSSCNGFSNANGQDMKSDVKGRLTDKTELLITGGIVLIGLAMVLKLMK